VRSKGAAHVAEGTDESAEDRDVFCGLRTVAFAEFAWEMDVWECRCRA